MKRIISVLLSFAIMLTALCVPAFAEGGTGGSGNIDGGGGSMGNATSHGSWNPGNEGVRIGLRLGQQLLRRCDELWVCGDRISSGMAREISEANHLSIPVKNIGAHEIQKEQLPAEMEQVTASGQGLGMT